MGYGRSFRAVGNDIFRDGKAFGGLRVRAGRTVCRCDPRSVLFTWAEKWLQCPISENDRQVLFKERKVWYNSRGIINYLKEEHLYANDSK